jgi:hypothetical protein
MSLATFDAVDSAANRRILQSPHSPFFKRERCAGDCGSKLNVMHGRDLPFMQQRVMTLTAGVVTLIAFGTVGNVKLAMRTPGLKFYAVNRTMSDCSVLMQPQVNTHRDARGADPQSMGSPRKRILTKLTFPHCP